MLCVLMLAGLAAGAPPERPSILVRQIEWRGAQPPAGLASLLTEQLLTSLHQSERFSRVTSPADLEATMGLEQQRQLLDCDAVSCFAEVAAALGATYMAIGTVGRLGSAYNLSLRVLSARRGAVEAVAARQVPIGQEDVLAATVDDMAHELLARLFGDAPLAARSTGHQRESHVTPSEQSPPPQRLLDPRRR